MIQLLKLQYLKLLLLLALLISFFASAADAKGTISIAYDSFRYSSELTDQESTLQYLNARYYNADLSRFIQLDTYDLLNLYGYVPDGNPIMDEDPSGHMKFEGIDLEDMGYGASFTDGEFAEAALATVANGPIGWTIGDVTVAVDALPGPLQNLRYVAADTSSSTLTTSSSSSSTRIVPSITLPSPARPASTPMSPAFVAPSGGNSVPMSPDALSPRSVNPPVNKKSKLGKLFEEVDEENKQTSLALFSPRNQGKAYGINNPETVILTTEEYTLQRLQHDQYAAMIRSKQQLYANLSRRDTKDAEQIRADIENLSTKMDKIKNLLNNATIQD